MSKKTQTLILALQDSIDKLGIDTTIENLKLACSKRDRSTKDFIIYQVCSFYRVEMETLRSVDKGKSKTKISQVLSYLLYYEGFLTQEEIGQLLGRSKASVNRYLKDLIHLKDEEPKEKALKSEIEFIENKINKFKSETYG
tara:strand:- start:46 stop:468 length:423 start_codon:yes stop_codon:yes gene_type:complete